MGGVGTETDGEGEGTGMDGEEEWPGRQKTLFRHVLG